MVVFYLKKDSPVCFIDPVFLCSQISAIMADDFDIEAMLEAPYKKVGV